MFSVKGSIRMGVAGAIVCVAAATMLRSQQAAPPAAPPQKAAPIPVQSIAAPKQPLPPEAESAGVTKFSFLAYGDTRGRRDGVELQYEHSLVVESMLVAIKRLVTTAYPVKFVLQSGDAVVNGRDPKQWNSSFLALINRLTTEGGVPYFLAPGNHDVTTALDLEATGRKEGLANYLAVVNNLIPANGAPHRLAGFPTFAFGYGNTFVIALDSNLGGEPTQLNWTRQQLQSLDRTRYTNIVVFFHHPPFSSGPHGGAHVENPTLAVRELYMPLFRKHHVRLVITGHEHLFEHWVERYEDTSGTHRMDVLVTGGGGAPLYAFQGEPDLAQYQREYEDERVRVQHLVKPGPDPGDNPYHFVIVQVDGTSLNLDVVGVDWGSNFKPYRTSSVSLSEQ